MVLVGALGNDLEGHGEVDPASAAPRTRWAEVATMTPPRRANASHVTQPPPKDAMYCPNPG